MNEIAIYAISFKQSIDQANEMEKKEDERHMQCEKWNLRITTVNK